MSRKTSDRGEVKAAECISKNLAEAVPEQFKATLFTVLEVYQEPGFLANRYS